MDSRLLGPIDAKVGGAVEAAVRAKHRRRLALPGVSHRSARLLRPLQGILDDG